MFTGFVAWIVLGLITSFIVSWLLNRRARGLGSDIVLGVISAVLCGWLFNAAGIAGVTSFNSWSLIAAVLAAAFLVFLHSRRSIRHT